MIIQNSEELHQYLNQNPDLINNTDDISKIIKESIEKLDPEKDKEEIKKLEIQRAVFSFTIEESNLEPKFTIKDQQGHLVSYPSIHAFTDKDFDFIDEVFKSSSSNILLAHYGHFLWINGKRHNTYLDKSIIGYVDLIKKLLTQNKGIKRGFEENKKYHYIGYLLPQVLFLAQKNRNVEIVRQLILDIINDPDHEFLFNSLALLMLETKKVFKNEDYDILIPKCLLYVGNLKSHFDKIRFYELGARIDQRLNKKSQNWTNLIAQQYEKLANERKDLAAISFANKAFRYYEESGEMEDAERMAKLYKEKSDTKELSKVQSEIDITDYVKYVDELIEESTKKSVEEIIIFLGNSPQIVPHKKFIDEMISSVGKGDRMRFFISNQIYDSNGHVAQNFTTQKEVNYMLTLENYSEVMKIRFDVLVNRLLFKLFDRDDWTAENFINILEQNSWYGQEIHKPVNSEQIVSLKIIDLIKPGIINYFDELRKFKADNNYQPNFTLCIDSLTMKVEAILREICILIDVRTFYTRKDKLDRFVTKEKDINMLLREKGLIQFLGEDIILYLKALLVERVGNNLRNRVAHGFLFPIQYQNLTVINKVLIALLVLSIWKITGITNEEENPA